MMETLATTLVRPIKPLLASLLKLVPVSVVRRLPPGVINQHSYLFGVYCPRFPAFDSKIVLRRTDDWTAIDVDARGIGSHGGETIDLFAKLLRHAGTVVDIGSHTGLYAIMAGIQNKSRRVYAFEPVPRIFQRLHGNITLNRARNVSALPYAVTNHDGEVRLFIPKGDFPTEASTLAGFREPAESISVPGVSVDSFVATDHVGTIDLMKVDTEGTEPKVLQGAQQCLMRDRPVLICEVLHGLTERALHDALDDLGYSYFLITHDGLIPKRRIEGDPTFRYLNYLMITEQRAEHFLNGLP